LRQPQPKASQFARWNYYFVTFRTLMLTPNRLPSSPWGENAANCNARSATQCRSNPVSRSQSPENGNISNIRRRLSAISLPETPIPEPGETDSQFAKARHWRAFVALQRARSAGAGLLGWEHSADHTRLHANSLLTGNFTGNFAILER
jgi:hypothetical protein